MVSGGGERRLWHQKNMSSIIHWVGMSLRIPLGLGVYQSSNGLIFSLGPISVWMQGLFWSGEAVCEVLWTWEKWILMGGLQGHCGAPPFPIELHVIVGSDTHLPFHRDSLTGGPDQWGPLHLRPEPPKL